MGLVLVASAANATGGNDLSDNRQLGSILTQDIMVMWAVSGPKGQGATPWTAADYKKKGPKVTPAEFKKAMLHLLDAKPGVMAQDVGLPDPVIYRSKVATTWEKYTPLAGHVATAWTMQSLLEAGTDPLTVTIEACRERGIPIVGSYRMNAEDFGGTQLDTFEFGRQHKEWRIAGANCLDPARPEVFAHRMAIFTELANEYDIDGIEFNFRRWHRMVSDPQQNHTVLTRMVRQTREMLDDVARKKGRKKMLLGVRVAPTLSGPSLGGMDMSCQDLGLDVRTWIKEELVDYVSPSFFWGHNPGDDPRTAEFAALAKGSNVGIYPTVFSYSKWQKGNDDAQRIEPDETEDLKRYRDDILNAALKCYAEGADGISTFNWVPAQQPEMTRRNIREGWGLGAAKVQMHLHPMLGDRAALQAYLESDVVLPQPSH